MAAGELWLPAVFLHEVEPSTGVETVELPIAANDNVRTDFYVYAWLRPCGETFYIGKGHAFRDKAPKSNNTLFMRIVAKMERNGQEPTIVRLHEGLTEDQAFALEMAEIAKHGRINIGTGTLANLTDGGEGCTGWVPSAETRAKQSAAKLGIPLKTEHRAKILLAVSNRSDASRAKMSASQTGRKHTEATLAKMRDNNAMLKPEYRAKVSAGLAGKPKSAEHKAKLSIVASNRSPDHLAGISAANRMRPPRSGYKGVSWNTAVGKWKVSIRVGDKRPFLGYFTDPVEAARAYDVAAIAAWGADGCYLNLANDNAPKSIAA